jgi:kynurenine formamidase
LSFTPPFLSREALCWLMDQGVRMLGVDTTGAVNPNTPDRWNHLLIFEAVALYVRDFTNLEAVPKSRVIVVTLSLAVEGLEGIPVRVVSLV